MSRISSPLRGRKPAKRIDTSALESLVRDGRMWVKLGKVFAPDSNSGTTLPHWKIETLDDGGQVILIEVETMPDQHDLTCRLATSGSGGGFGLWSIPRVGSIVAVLVPDGAIEFHPMVIGVLDCNAPPVDMADIGNTTTLLADDRTVTIRAPKVQAGGTDADQAFVRGTGYRSSEDTMILELATAFGSLETASTGTLSPLASGFHAVVVALQKFQTAASAANGYLSTVVFGK